MIKYIKTSALTIALLFSAVAFLSAKTKAALCKPDVISEEYSFVNEEIEKSFYSNISNSYEVLQLLETKQSIINAYEKGEKQVYEEGVEVLLIPILLADENDFYISLKEVDIKSGKLISAFGKLDGEPGEEKILGILKGEYEMQQSPPIQASSSVVGAGEINFNSKPMSREAVLLSEVALSESISYFPAASFVKFSGSIKQKKLNFLGMEETGYEELGGDVISPDLLISGDVWQYKNFSSVKLSIKKSEGGTESVIYECEEKTNSSDYVRLYVKTLRNLLRGYSKAAYAELKLIIPPGIKGEAAVEVGDKYAFLLRNKESQKTVLEAGSYEVRVTIKGCKDFSKTINVEKGDDKLIELKLEEDIGSIEQEKVYTLESGYQIIYNDQVLSKYEGKESVILGTYKSGEYNVVVDGKTKASFDESKSYFPVFNENGNTWLLKYKKDERSYFLTSSGNEYGPYEKIGDTIFAGDKWTTTIQKADGNFYIINSEANEHGPYKFVDSVVFGGNGKNSAFIITRPDGRKEVYIDNGNKLLGTYENAKDFVFSQDASAYSFCIEKTNSKNYIIFSDGKEFGPYEAAGHITLNDDGSRWSFQYADENGHWRIKMSDGEEYGPYKRAVSMQYSQNKDSYGFRVRKYKDKKTYYIINDSEPQGPYEKAKPIVFSEAGRNYGYSAMKNDNLYYISVNGNTKFGEYKEASSPSFSADGGTWGFSAVQNGGGYIILNSGKKYGPFRTQPDIIFSQDGSRWGFPAKRPGGSWYFFNDDGKEYGPYTAVEDAQYYSGNDDKWAWTFSPGGNTNIVLVSEGYEYSQNISSPKIKQSENGSFLYWFSQQKNDIYLNKYFLKKE